MNTLTHIFKLTSTTAVVLILCSTLVLLEGCASTSSKPETFPYICYVSWSVCA